MARKSRRGWVWVGVGLLVLLAAGAGAAIFINRDRATRSGAAAASDDPALSQIDPDGPWEKVQEEGAALAVPKGWTTLDKFSPQVLIFRKAEGKGGVPATDEAGGKLEAEIILEKIRMDPALEEAANVVADRILKTPQTSMVTRPVGQRIKLADGTDAFIMSTELIQAETRRALMIKLLAKSDERSGFVVTGQITASKDSEIPTADSKLGRWMRELTESLVLDPAKLDVKSVNAAYRDRDRQ